jgi:hypothetical protein
VVKFFRWFDGDNLAAPLGQLGRDVSSACTHFEHAPREIRAKNACENSRAVHIVVVVHGFVTVSHRGCVVVTHLEWQN